MRTRTYGPPPGGPRRFVPGPGRSSGPGPGRPFSPRPARPVPAGEPVGVPRPPILPPAAPQRPHAPWLSGEAQQQPTLFRPDEEELIAGRRPVEEAFVARRTALRLLIVPQRRQALERIVLHATTLRIPVVEVEGGTLTAVAGFDGHQGVALAVTPRRFADLDEILARAIERGEPPLVLVLDSLEDPQNVGTLLRSAEAAGAHGVIFPTRRQAPLSPAAIKASAGATEHLLLAPVDDLAGALADLHVRGLRIAGAEAEAPLTARQADLRGPLAVVIGSEGHGLSPAVRRRCDLSIRIPLRGAVGSLNAAVAGSILLFEAVAQRDPDGLGARQPAAPRAPAGADPTPAGSNDEPALKGLSVGTPGPAHLANADGAADATEETAVGVTPPGLGEDETATTSGAAAADPAEPSAASSPDTRAGEPAAPAQVAEAAAESPVPDPDLLPGEPKAPTTRRRRRATGGA
jgi:23S rRNA (guanosine2251-2'-O)-methyltransferase